MAKNNNEANNLSAFVDDVIVRDLGFQRNRITIDVSLATFGITDNSNSQKRPDLLISKVQFDSNNTTYFINNLLFYAEAKDVSCKVNDLNWLDAINQGVLKSVALKLNYFGVTNCSVTRIYNRLAVESIIKNNANYVCSDFDKAIITINGKTDCIFPNLQAVFSLQKNIRSLGNSNIDLSDEINSMSESSFRKILKRLREPYRNTDFDGSTMIDFTIGMITLKMSEEKYPAGIITKTENNNKQQFTFKLWSNINKSDIKNDLTVMINGLSSSHEFQDFKELITKILPIIAKSKDDVLVNIYEYINELGQLHNSSFDIFGVIYVEYGSSSEKKFFGEFFTRRNYTHTLVNILLKDEKQYKNKQFKVLDPTCGTGGFLTEVFKVLQKNYIKSDTYTEEAINFISSNCIYGTDIKSDNIARTKLNMFLIGDGHSHIKRCDSMDRNEFKLQFDDEKLKFDYIVANPPYGSGNTYDISDYFKTDRKELAFLFRIIELLNIGGKACVVIPDGILENDSMNVARLEFLKNAKLNAVVSLPIHAFAPYTKEKTFVLFFEKRDSPLSDNDLLKESVQLERTWMYIIDNDGYANSDKRFQTKLIDNKGQWLHDELSPWINYDNGTFNKSILEDRFMQYADSETSPTSIIDDKGIKRQVRKAKDICFKDIIKSCKLSGSKESNGNSYVLLPEFYLRKNIENHLNGDYDLSDLFIFGKQTANKTIDGEKITLNLTEEKIYLMLQNVDFDNAEMIPVFSGATENNGLIGNIPKPILNYELCKDDFRFINRDDGTLISNINIFDWAKNEGLDVNQCFDKLLNTYNGLIFLNDILYVINNQDLLTIVADGKAGYMFVRNSDEYPIFAMNISSFAMIPKYNFDLNWFVNKYNEHFINIEKGQGVRHFTQNKINNISVDIPMELEITKSKDKTNKNINIQIKNKSKNKNKSKSSNEVSQINLVNNNSYVRSNETTKHHIDDLIVNHRDENGNYVYKGL